MRTKTECVCCVEMPAVNCLRDDLECITHHPAIVENCMSIRVLEVSLYDIQREGPLDDNNTSRDSLGTKSSRRQKIVQAFLLPAIFGNLNKLRPDPFFYRMLHPIAAQYGIITLSIIDYDNQIIGLQWLCVDRITKMADSYYHLPD